MEIKSAKNGCWRYQEQTGLQWAIYFSNLGLFAFDNDNSPAFIKRENTLKKISLIRKYPSKTIDIAGTYFSKGDG